MDNSSNKELTGQVGTRSTPQSTRATTPENGTTLCGNCGCHISDILTTKLQDTVACPTCTTNAMISTTKQIKQRIIELGGAFAAKEWRASHNKIKRDWRFVKITLANGAAKWEALMDDVRVLPGDLANIKNALGTFDKHKMQMAKVPGVIYGQEPKEKEPTEEDHQTARLMIQLLRLILEKELSDDEKASPSASGKEELGSPRDSQSDSSPTRQEHVYRNETELASPPPSTTSTPGTPKSILKRKASMWLPKISSQKRIRIADTVTISPPRLNIINPSPFIKLPDTVTTKTHAEHTCAQQQRGRLVFKRSAPHYLPGVWASGAFEEKARTSNFRVSWDSIESHVATELKEAEDEEEVFTVIKATSAAWVGVWWIRRVMYLIGLEQ